VGVLSDEMFFFEDHGLQLKGDKRQKQNYFLPNFLFWETNIGNSTKPLKAAVGNN